MKKADCQGKTTLEEKNFFLQWNLAKLSSISDFAQICLKKDIEKSVSELKICIICLIIQGKILIF